MTTRSSCLSPEEIARICHEANRAYCLAFDDHSQVHWEVAPEGVVCSAIDGVLHALSNPGISSQEMHANWVAFKAQTGWRYGPIKDSDKKEHPCMVPYDDLPAYQKRKDELFLAIVNALR